MAKLRLSLAISDYVHTRDIADGLINPVGIELIVNNLVFEQAAFRFGANREFDVSEFSFANYCAIGSSPRWRRHCCAACVSVASVPALVDLYQPGVGPPHRKRPQGS